MKIILTTYPNRPRELKNFIYKILKKKLAVCVNKINYVKSYYIWEWKIKKDQEQILLIKTSDKNLEKLKEFLEKNHPYEVPEILVLNPMEVNDSYLNWVNNI